MQSSGLPQDVSRYRNSFWWGWNNTTVPFEGTLGTLVPVLPVYGEHGHPGEPPVDRPLLNFSVPALYAAIPGADKLMIKVACAGHSMPWENRAKDLHYMTREWLKHTVVAGLMSGSHALDMNGTRSCPSLAISVGLPGKLGGFLCGDAGGRTCRGADAVVGFSRAFWVVDGQDGRRSAGRAG